MEVFFSDGDFPEKELSDFFKMLLILNQKEQDAGTLFLQSPFFNTDQNVSDLYTRLLNSYRSAVGRGAAMLRINGRPLLKSIFGEMEEEKARKQLRRTFRKLNDLMLEFMEHQQLKTDRRLGDMVRMQFLKRTTHVSLFRASAEALEAKVTNTIPDIQLFQDRWTLYHQQYFHQYARHYDSEGAAVLLQAFYNVEKTHHLSLLRYYCEVLNRRRIMGPESDFTELEQQVENLIDPDAPEPLICLYSRLIPVMKNPADTGSYFLFKNNFKNLHQQISRPDRLVMLKSVFNIWIRHYEMGKPDAPQELIFWVKQGLECGAFLYADKMSDKEYLNIAMAAGIAGEMEFLKEFIETYRSFLIPDVREPAYNLALIYWHFTQNNLRKVVRLMLEHFPKNNQEDHFYTLRYKTIAVLTYLMGSLSENAEKLTGLNQNDCEIAFERELANFKKYVSRVNFLNKKRRIPYRRFTNICRSIYNYFWGNTNRQTAEKRNRIITRIRAEEPLIARYVLMQITDMLPHR